MDPVLQQKLGHLPGDYVSDFPMASCMNTRPVEQDSKATPMPLEIHAEQHASFFYLDVHFLDGRAFKSCRHRNRHIYIALILFNRIADYFYNSADFAKVTWHMQPLRKE